ncbi:MAG: glycosyltransferase family 39 protein [Bacteroidales bacterium]|nr:glycosyltransferase family 39 protein [Bacteroidales bacterium]
MTINRVASIFVISILSVASLFQIFQNLGTEHIKIWDEAIGAYKAIDMMSAADYLVVPIEEQEDLIDTKPPLAIWLKVISYKIFGINEFAVRLPSAMAGVFILFGFFVFLRRFLNRDFAFPLVLILASCSYAFMGYHFVRNGDPDVILSLFVVGYFLVYFIIIEGFNERKNYHYFLLGLMVLGAYYTKSLAGLSPLIGLVIYTFFRKNGYKIVKDYRFHVTWFITVLLILSYYLIREVYDSGYIAKVIEMEWNYVKNYPFDPKHPHFDFYFMYLINDAFYPFMYFFPVSFIGAYLTKDKRVRDFLLYGILCILSYLILQSSVVIKNEWYIAPIFPMLWIVIGLGFYESLNHLLSLIKSVSIKDYTYLMIVLVIAAIVSPIYTDIFKRNTQQALSNSIYDPEREGQYLRDLYTTGFDIRNLHLIKKKHTRQLLFYVKKYNYEDSLNLSVHSSVDEDLIGSKVLVCEENFKEVVRNQYDYESLSKGKYGEVFFLKGKID